LRLPLVYQGAWIGQMVLGPRAPGEPFTSADRRLLDDLSHQVAVAARAVRLTAELQRVARDLQQSRERLVVAREEERRRLRRDLHDGLGPTLAALALSASTIPDMIPTNPIAAGSLARQLEADIRATVGEIRRLIHDLRPPALDELGLTGAIRDRASQLASRPESGATRGPRVRVEAPEKLPPLPAAVEVAAYRIVEEALTNAVRHAQAHLCIIRLSLAVALELTIIDDGAGLPPDYQAGVGLRSMRERAEELGGEVRVEPQPRGGTRVWARLPIPEKLA
jgi:signal transduction histidine kinase